jgi:SlyX protein
MAAKDHLIELETKLAYQEDMIQELNSVICRQQDQIDDLIAKFGLLVERANELSSKASLARAEDEIPPHY